MKEKQSRESKLRLLTPTTWKGKNFKQGASQTISHLTIANSNVSTDSSAVLWPRKAYYTLEELLDQFTTFRRPQKISIRT